jgi:hypothetical protein
MIQYSIKGGSRALPELKTGGLSPSDSSTGCVLLQTGGGDEREKDSRNEDKAVRILLVQRDKEVLISLPPSLSLSFSLSLFLSLSLSLSLSLCL